MEALKNPTIFIGDLRIDEPVTTGTDIIVAIIGIIAFMGLRGAGSPKHVAWFRWFFLVTAVSTLVSSLIGHAFVYHFGIEARIYGWMIGVLSASCAQFAATYHAQAYVKPKTFRGLMIFNIVETLAACVVTPIVNQFIVVEIHSAIAMLFILVPMEGFIFSRTRSVLSRNMLIGVGFCICAVLCHVLKLAISPWFNHLDISHVFMAAGMLSMYLGVRNEKKTFISSGIGGHRL